MQGSEFDDVVMEPEDGEGNTANAGQKLKELREKLKEVQKQRDEYLDSLQRMKADYVNAGKRHEADMKAFSQFASQGLVMELLPVMDALDQAIEHSKGEDAGIQMVRGQLQKVFSAHGVDMVDPVGAQFDPATMESVEILEVTDAAQDNVVTKVHQKGYTLNGKSIRPARVAVGHYKE